jgi:CheY-like chemotaxis protein
MDHESCTGLAILVVEDEAVLRMMIVEMLEELGHRACCETSRLDEAITPASEQTLTLPSSTSMLRGSRLAAQLVHAPLIILKIDTAESHLILLALNRYDNVTVGRAPLPAPPELPSPANFGAKPRMSCPASTARRSLATPSPLFEASPTKRTFSIVLPRRGMPAAVAWISLQGDLSDELVRMSQ